MVETRIAPRYRASKAATIEFVGGAIDCMVRDPSITGAALSVSTKSASPGNSDWLCTATDYVCHAMSSGAEDIGWVLLSISRLSRQSLSIATALALSHRSPSRRYASAAARIMRLHSILCGGRPHTVSRPTARPAPAHGSQPYRWRCRDRRERYNGFRTLIPGGHHRGRLFDGREQRSTGISDLPTVIVALNKGLTEDIEPRGKRRQALCPVGPV